MGKGKGVLKWVQLESQLVLHTLSWDSLKFAATVHSSGEEEERDTCFTVTQGSNPRLGKDMTLGEEETHGLHRSVRCREESFLSIERTHPLDAPTRMSPSSSLGRVFSLPFTVSSFLGSNNFWRTVSLPSQVSPNFSLLSSRYGDDSGSDEKKRAYSSPCKPVKQTRSEKKLRTQPRNYDTIWRRYDCVLTESFEIRLRNRDIFLLSLFQRTLIAYALPPPLPLLFLYRGFGNFPFA